MIDKISVPRASDVLAERLRRMILDGDLRPGERLPTERQMVEQAGLGRASVREALHILEGDNLVEARVGRHGGWLVRRPGGESVARSLDVFIRGHQLRFTSLLEARETIEPGCAALAARHRHDEDLRQIEHRNQRVRAVSDDVPQYLIENVRWHLAVVNATHNELLIALMSALSDSIHAATDVEGFNSEEVRNASIEAHERVVTAIRDQDEEAAFRRMRRHLAAYRVQTTGLLDDLEVPTGPRARSVRGSRAPVAKRPRPR